VEEMKTANYHWTPDQGFMVWRPIGWKKYKFLFLNNYKFVLETIKRFLGALINSGF